MPDKPTLEEWLAKAKEVNGTAFEFLSEYTEHRKLVSLRCTTCGHIFQRRADVVIKSAAGCPRCDNKFYDYERFKDELTALKIDLEGLQEPLEWIGQNTLLTVYMSYPWTSRNHG